MQYLLTLSTLDGEVADTAVVENAASGVWREVYPPSGVPVPMVDRAAVVLGHTDLRAFLDALEVGCDGIEGDDARDPDHDTEARVRRALVRFLKVARNRA